MKRSGKQTTDHPLLALIALLRPPLAEFRHVHLLEVTLSQLSAMLVLGEAGSQTVSSLADQIGLSRAATSHLVERLVKRKLLDRTEDPEDRRQKRVTLAKKGQELLREIAEVHRRSARALWVALSPPERSQAESHVLGLVELLRSARVEPGSGDRADGSVEEQ